MGTARGVFFGAECSSLTGSCIIRSLSPSVDKGSFTATNSILGVFEEPIGCTRGPGGRNPLTGLDDGLPSMSNRGKWFRNVEGRAREVASEELGLLVLPSTSNLFVSLIIGRLWKQGGMFGGDETGLGEGARRPLLATISGGICKVLVVLPLPCFDGGFPSSQGSLDFIGGLEAIEMPV
jgi:hypothetical protein